jgi:hypothetical protein
LRPSTDLRGCRTRRDPSCEVGRTAACSSSCISG